MGDIDFSGRSNIKSNITVNRLEAENNIYTLKNINLEISTSNSGLINNVKTSIKNIGFENITLTKTGGSGEYFGIITVNNGIVENLRFKDIILNANGMNYVGIIGGMTSGNINNIEMKNVTINGNAYLGGLLGSVDINQEIKNIIANNITVIGSSDYVGGVIGIQKGNNIEIDNIYVNNSHITGKQWTGGILGVGTYGLFSHFVIENSEITGTSFVGGIIGRTSSNESTNKREYMNISSCIINGSGNDIGGIIGSMNGGENRYWTVNDTQVNATTVGNSNIGGVAGNTTWWTLNYFQVVDSSVNSNGTNVGGVVGRITRRNRSGKLLLKSKHFN